MGDPLARTPRRRTRIDAVEVLPVLRVHIDRACTKGGRARRQCRDDRSIELHEDRWVARFGREEERTHRRRAGVLTAVRARSDREARARLPTIDHDHGDLRDLARSSLNGEPARSAAPWCSDRRAELDVHARIMTGRAQ